MTPYTNSTASKLHAPKDVSFVGQLMAISHFVRKNTMELLTASGRYPRLSLSYVGYLSLLLEQQLSPGELAQKLGISKQSCSKTIGELEKLGLLARHSNPADSRSTILSLSPQGIALLHDGFEASGDVQRQLAELVGTGAVTQLIDILGKLTRGFGIETPTFRALELANDTPANGRPTQLNQLLSSLSDYFYQHLIDALSEQGFAGLKPNFSQVMGLIGPEGVQIQYIASLVGVSKQAIAVIAAKLTKLGYITRTPAPQDKRQIILRLSPMGEQLLRESTANIEALEASIEAMLSPQEFRHLNETTATLCFELASHSISETVLPARIQQLSRQLLDELGVTGARALAQQLMTITRGKR